VLAVEGRLVQIAFLKSPRVEVDLMQVMRRRLTITGSTLRPRSPEEKGAIARATRRQRLAALRDGTVKPVIVHAVFPLERAADAHRMMEAREHIGKIVLTVAASRARPRVLEPLPSETPDESGLGPLSVSSPRASS
jgi:NADPH:quinone reductase